MGVELNLIILPGPGSKQAPDQGESTDAECFRVLKAITPSGSRDVHENHGPLGINRPYDPQPPDPGTV